MLVCVSTLILERSRFIIQYFNTVDQQAALRWVQKYVSLLVLHFVIGNWFSFRRSVNSAETRIKLRFGEFQPALAQFYNMLSQMVEKHRHHFSERQLRARPSCHLSIITKIAFQRYVDVMPDPFLPRAETWQLLYSEVVNQTKYIFVTYSGSLLLKRASAVHLLKIHSIVCELSMSTTLKLPIWKLTPAVSLVLLSLSLSSMGISSPKARLSF